MPWPPKRITLVGDSFVRRLHQHEQQELSLPDNLGFDSRLHMASFIGAINGTVLSHITDLTDAVLNAIKDRVRTCHVLWLIIGTNDICDHPGRMDADVAHLISVAEVLLATCAGKVALKEVYPRMAPHGFPGTAIDYLPVDELSTWDDAQSLFLLQRGTQGSM